MAPSSEQPSEVDRLREHLRTYDGGRDAALAEFDDEMLREVIAETKKRIGGLRMSWIIVAANYLRDGEYHG